jgi:ribosomal protein S27AE
MTTCDLVITMRACDVPAEQLEFAAARVPCKFCGQVCLLADHAARHACAGVPVACVPCVFERRILEQTHTAILPPIGEIVDFAKHVPRQRARRN